MSDQVKEFNIPIVWESDEGKLAEFANHMSVSFDGNTYTLRFFQALPPVIDPSNLAALANVRSIPAKHIVTLVVTAPHMRNIVQALNDAVVKVEEN